MSMSALRAARVEWPIPNRQGHPSCPLCGLSALHFVGDRGPKLQRHIDSPHSHCKDCGRVMGAHRFVAHRKAHHRYPTMPIPGMEAVA